jgi:hypothetical protein
LGGKHPYAGGKKRQERAAKGWHVIHHSARSGHGLIAQFFQVEKKYCNVGDVSSSRCVVCSCAEDVYNCLPAEGKLYFVSVLYTTFPKRVAFLGRLGL